MVKALSLSLPQALICLLTVVTPSRSMIHRSPSPVCGNFFAPSPRIHSRAGGTASCRYRECDDRLRALCVTSPKNGVGGEGGDKEEEVGHTSYGDDAFGLIFLNSAFVLGDYGFAAVFLILSAAASASVSSGILRLPSRKLPSLVASDLLPGVVALMSLALSYSGAVGRVADLFEIALPELTWDDGRTVALELAACVISIAWGVAKEHRR